MQTLAVEYITLDALHAYDKNARTHSDSQVDQLCDSIREFGFTNPVLIDENNELIAGHGRTLAAKRLGLKEVPAIRLKNLTPTQVKALRLADNQLALNAGWDYALLKAELDELSETDFDLDMLGFDLAEIDAQLEDEVEPDDRTIEEGNVSEPPTEPVTQAGDVWTLGRHRLVCGDSTKAETFALLMQGESADVTITSPPYGVASSAKLREHYVKGKEQLKSFYDKHDDNKTQWASLMRDFLLQCRAHSQCQFVNVQMLADNKRDLIDWWHTESVRLTV